MWVTAGAFAPAVTAPDNKLWSVMVHEFLHVAVRCEGESGSHEHTTPNIWLPDSLSAEAIAQDSDTGDCAL
jgi:hypothetical protein